MVETKISPPGRLRLDLRELWEYRELLYFFAWRDIKVKYKQTALGFAWAILQPLVMMLIFSVFFGSALNVPSDNIPYPIFVFSGLMLWNVFSSGLTSAGNSMVSNANIIKKIYFPRMIIPFSSIIVSTFDFLMAFIIYIGMVIYYGYSLDVSVIYLIPLALILTIVATLGMSLIIAAMNVKFRDFRYILPFLVQILLFLTPVIYPLTMLDKWPILTKVLSFNPMYAPISLIRSALIDRPIEMTPVLSSVGSGLVILIIGILYFKRTESYFADIA